MLVLNISPDKQCLGMLACLKSNGKFIDKTCTIYRPAKEAKKYLLVGTETSKKMSSVIKRKLPKFPKGPSPNLT